MPANARRPIYARDIIVTDRPLWADLHNHNDMGYGKGSLDRSYEIARGARLDAYCFTPHGLWHDRPADDAEMKAFHERGFDRVRRTWDRVVQKANAENEDGTFAAFIGFEWHSSAFGDFHVIFPGGEGELLAPNRAAELRDFCRERGALMVPHHVAYRQGWRGANWAEVDPELAPVVEVFSEHGCGMEAESAWPMLGHSMGGSDRSQSVMEELRRGRVAGVVASTDNHWGHPASYGEGLTGVWADRCDRAAVFEAIRRRHTYAVTGDRIRLDVRLGDGRMGDVLPVDTHRRLWAEVAALGEVDSVQVLKNGRVVHCHTEPAGGVEGRYVVRLEFGWGAMTSEALTDWHIRAWVKGGRLERVVPCFAGGAGSVDRVNRIESMLPNEVTFEAFTSRRNTRPTSALLLEVEGNRETRIEVNTVAEHEGKEYGCDLSAGLDELLGRDAWAGISEVFSAPKVCLGRAHPCGELRFDVDWMDPEPGEGDWYLVKVQQKNGHIAWSSPAWCR
jgi:hypothetical protein